MATSVVVLTLFFFLHLSLAEVEQLDERAGEVHSMKTHNNTELDSFSAAAGSHENGAQMWIILRDLGAKVRRTEKELEDLRGQSQGNRVAFGATTGYSGNYGPFNTEVTLVYKTVYANTGAYNPATGIFTAPVKGMYYFSFSGHNIATKPMGLRLMKNGVQMVTVFNHVGAKRWETATNGMNLQLNVGDQVYMRLRANTWIYDNENNHNTFIGHLLFRL